jgi:hypothetical protein
MDPGTIGCCKSPLISQRTALTTTLNILERGSEQRYREVYVTITVALCPNAIGEVACCQLIASASHSDI